MRLRLLLRGQQLRDFYDRRHVGVVLIGMPGLQKRLARYAQLYSRLGFVHQFRPLSGQELHGVIERQWVQLGLDLALYEHADAAVVYAIARVTGGNFRLVERLFAQIERIVAINNLSAVTTEVITLAGERLGRRAALTRTITLISVPRPPHNDEDTRQLSLKITRRLVAEDPRFGGRGRPAFLVTTPTFLRTMGLASLAELPPRVVQTEVAANHYFSP